MNETSSLTSDNEVAPEQRSKAGRIKRISASKQIHDAMRERIVSLELYPGESLSRAEIAEYYGVSQTPVRDAMLKLEEEGLLLIFPQSKTEVSKIDVDQARETQFLRLSIELEVTRRLASKTNSAHVTAIGDVLTDQQNAHAANKIGEFARLDRLFHRTMYELVGVENLWTLVTSRSGHLDRLRNLNLPDPGKMANILYYHEKILQSIGAGDVAATETAVREHLSGTLKTVDRIIARHPDYF